MYFVMPDLISLPREVSLVVILLWGLPCEVSLVVILLWGLPCEILFCVVFNRACPVLDTGASRGLAGFVYNHYLTGFPDPALDPDPGFAGMTGTGSGATNGLCILLFN